MAELRYIGARYVPRFMGTYDNTQVYEALDVVDDGASTTYIAKVPVPANTPLSNTTYWSIYGDFGAIATLEQEIADMKDGTVTGSLQYQINANDDEIADMKDGTVTGSLQYQINANDYEIADMKDGTVTGSLQYQINANDDEIADMKDGTVPGSLQEQINQLSGLSIKDFSITHGNSKAVTLSAGFRGCLISPGTANDLACIYSMTCDSSGIVRCDKLSNDTAGTAVGVSVGSYTITFTNNSGTATFNPRILIFNGNLTV
jgi:hypothetical protein